MEQRVEENRFKRTEFAFVKYTVQFCIFGFFFCAVPLYLLLAIQSIFDMFLHNCVQSMRLTWCLCLFGCILTPLLFNLHLKRKEVYSNQLLKKQLGLFNALTLTFIQGALGIFSSDPQFLCYGTDGQNGLELIFNAWCALPILILISYYFKTLNIIAEFS